MLAGTRKGEHVLHVNVASKKWDKTVACTVTVNVVYLNNTVVTSSASLRLAGVFYMQLCFVQYVCQCFGTVV